MRLAGVDAEGATASMNIDLRRHRFQMCRVHAGAMDAAPCCYMVDLEALGDRSDEEFMGYPVCESRLPVHPDDAIARADESALPYPAAVFAGSPLKSEAFL